MPLEMRLKVPKTVILVSHAQAFIEGLVGIVVADRTNIAPWDLQLLISLRILCLDGVHGNLKLFWVVTDRKSVV